MSTVDPKDLAAFAEQADAWFAENVVRDPGFMLPLTFMEVGTDPQFNFLRDWQNKVWEAGYLGAAWPKAYGRYARYMILLARTDPSTERKYDGLSFFLMPMKAPGIETVPIRKLTGEHGFTQTFFTDARAPAEGLVGPEGGGWKVAMRTLEYERGARGGQAGGYVSVGANAFDVFDLAQRTKRGGRPVLEDPQVADEMVGFLMEIQALTLNGQRTQVPELIADRPQGIPLASKLMGTEMSRRLNDFAVRLTGVRGAYYVDEPEAADNGLWARNYLNSFSATIGGGTSQIQANIVGEHVLGLPKS